MNRRKFLEKLGLGVVATVVTGNVISDTVRKEWTAETNDVAVLHPKGYYTEKELNPPDLDAWAVARGFPRKHSPATTAKIKL